MTKVKDNAVAIRPKVLKRFYEPVLLLHVLGRQRGARTRRPIDEGDLRHSRIQRQRDFTDAIAYICAFATGGKHVIATALEKTPQGITVWLAANDSTHNSVILAFLRDILTELEAVNRASQAETESRIFSKIVEFNRTRIDQYWCKTKERITQCLEVIHESEEFQGRDELIKWLEVELVGYSQNAENLVKECYSAARHGTQRERFDAIERFLVDGKPNSESFEMLRYYICRLGKHLAIAKRMVKLSLSDIILFSGFEIKFLNSPKSIPFKLPHRTKIEDMFNRMFSPEEGEDKEALLRHLTLISDALGHLAILKVKYPTNVHAELILVDHFYTNKLNFVNDDKYVGCSKPACFLCFQYISAHPGGFALPATHQKIYPYWRHPDIITDHNCNGDCETMRSNGGCERCGKLQRLEKSREDIINEMNKKIRAHLIEQIKKGIHEKRKTHPDSSTGVSTYLAETYPDPSASLSTRLAALAV